MQLRMAGIAERNPLVGELPSSASGKQAMMLQIFFRPAGGAGSSGQSLWGASQRRERNVDHWLGHGALGFAPRSGAGAGSRDREVRRVGDQPIPRHPQYSLMPWWRGTLTSGWGAVAETGTGIGKRGLIA